MAENAGGPHCLRYGTTTNHVLGLEIVTADGQVLWLGGKTADTPGYDLTGVIVGSEGTLAIVTKVIVRLLHKPEATITLLAIFDAVTQLGSANAPFVRQTKDEFERDRSPRISENR